MRFILYLAILILLLINIYLYIELKKADAVVNRQIVEIKKVETKYKEKQEQHQLLKEIKEIRGLGFLRPVIYKTMDKAELIALVQEKMEEEPILVDERILKKFGFIKQAEGILSHITSLYSEQVQGMYDEETGQMVLVKSLPLTGNIQRMFLVHELTHALQDQHFDLKGLPLADEDDDKALACLSLVEGDATLVMFGYYKSHLKIFNVLWDLMSYLSVDQTQLYSSPYYLRENLIFPYKWGIKFVTGIYTRNGWEGVNLAYKDPPESTEQIMHPEKYQIEKPIEVTIDETIPSWRLLDANTMGEFNIRVLLSIYLGEYNAIATSSGWGGDKWQVWEDENTGQLRIIWYTMWDTAKDADEFFNAFKKLVRRRYLNAKISKKGKMVKLYW